MIGVTRRVLIVDDHAGFRSSARALLEAGGRLAVIGEAGTGSEALAAVTELQPDIVLLDIVLPDLDGFTVCDAILRNDPLQPAVVLTSSRGRALYGPQLAASQARGFIPKDELSAAAVIDLAG